MILNATLPLNLFTLVIIGRAGGHSETVRINCVVIILNTRFTVSNYFKLYKMSAVQFLLLGHFSISKHCLVYDTPINL